MLVLKEIDPTMAFNASRNHATFVESRAAAFNFKRSNPDWVVDFRVEDGKMYVVTERASICEEIDQTLSRFKDPKCIIMNREQLEVFLNETSHTFTAPPLGSDYLKGKPYVYARLPVYISENVGDQVQVY